MEYLQYYYDAKFTKEVDVGFKPCYKWNTFNTKEYISYLYNGSEVLNLVISGIPSILKRKNSRPKERNKRVLNLVISGIPSIPI